MKRYAILCAVLALIGSAALAADKFEDASLGISLDIPPGFAASAEKPKEEFLGDVRGAFRAKDFPDTAGQLLVHHMGMPDGMDYNQFKDGLGGLLQAYFGTGYKLVKQEDIESAKRSGFSLEFECPGDGMEPKAGGNITHHVRWYFLKDAGDKLIGVLYSGRDAAWKDLEPKITASFKSVKAL